MVRVIASLLSKHMHQLLADAAMDDYYKTLQHTIDNVPRRDIKILMGGFNAQVGMDNVTWKGVSGHFRYGSMNDRGERGFVGSTS